MSQTVYIIVGPTAVGKTAYAIKLAQQLDTEIISADARQCYAQLNFGVARPSDEELNLVPHHFIASHSIHETVNAVVFEKYALAKAASILNTKKDLVMVGGTGLYIKAFCEGLDEIPAIDAAIRSSILQQYNEKGIEWLQQQVSQQDPVFWEQAEKQNPQRLMRALEVKLGSGESIISFQQKNTTVRPFKIVLVGLQLPREEVYNRINQRVNTMLDMGLEEEVLSLKPFFHLNALQTVGYKEWEPYFKGEITKQRVVELIQQNTRQYAKRQITWFKKNPLIRWVSSEDDFFEPGKSG